MNYHLKEEDLHKRWERRYPAEVYNKDGLLYLGKQLNPNIKSREPGEEEALWGKADIKILFVLKESHSNNNQQDVREWMPHKSNARLYNNMCRLVYGISNFNKKDYSYPSYDALNMQKVKAVVADIPFGYINVKKTSGLSASKDKEIIELFLRDSDLIEEQIKILNPNVIIFCGILWKSQDVKSKVMAMFNCYKEKDDSWITTNDTKDIAIVDSYHLNPRGRISDENFYLNFMESYKDYCKRD